MTGNEGLVEACGDTPAHACMWKKEEKDTSCGSAAAPRWSFLSMWMFVCVQCHSVCVWLPRLQLRDQARTRSSMWVNCDLAISLPGGDKSSSCWSVNHSVITSSCHDCLRMQASGNLHCRSFTDTREKHTASLFVQLSFLLRVLSIR